MKKTALIIGGTKGIGKSVFNKLKSKRFKVFSLSRDKKKSLSHISCDILDFSNQSIDKVPKKLDCLVFSQRYRGTDDIKHFDISVFAIDKILCQLASRLQKNSSVIFIGSPASKFVFDEQPAFYHAAKAALEALTRFYAVKFGKQGVRFNCVLPGTVIKNENYNYYKKNKKVQLRIQSITPAGRMGTAEDVANLVSFLACQDSTFLTGQTYVVDGGISILSQISCVNRILKEL